MPTFKVPSDLEHHIKSGAIRAGDTIHVARGGVATINGHDSDKWIDEDLRASFYDGVKDEGDSPPVVSKISAHMQRSFERDPVFQEPRLHPQTGEQIDEAELLNPVQVQNFLGVSRTTLQRLRLADDFPRPLVFSERVIRWQRSDLDIWVGKHRPT